MNICIIPARGGSRRITKKSIRDFHGKPIIAYSIEVAQKSGLFDKVIVSTDDDEIANVATQYGALIHKRSEAMGCDEVGTQAVARDVLSQGVGGRYACVIYPCSPLLDVKSLRRGFESLKKYDASFSFSIGTMPLCDAGNFYWGYVSAFANSVDLFSEPSLMIPLPPERVCDVNTPEDWKRCEEMYEALHESD